MPTDAFDDLLDRLDGVRRRGHDQADARCPAHDDHKASLSVARGANGRTILHCHAGCSWTAVLAAVGIEASLMFGEPTLLREHTYTDEIGTPLYVVERWEPKDFRQRLANGQRRAPARDRRVLYNLPAIKWVREHSESRSLFYVEGEHDVDTLAGQGYVATTSLGGANKPWEQQYTDELAGLRVIIIADDDTPGRRWAHTVADNLAQACQTTIMMPPQGCKDVSDMIDGGYPITALRPLPDTIGEVMTAADYPETVVEWLWPGRLPRGMLTLLEGDPGTGKSTIVIELIACLTTGRPLPGVSLHDVRPLPLRVAMLADEDPWGAVVVPRLRAAGADLSRVLHLRGIRSGAYLSSYSLSDLDTLRHDLAKVHADVLIIDPIMGYLGGVNDVDAHKDQHVRSVLGPLVQMAEEDQRTIIAIRHFTKQTGGKAIYRGGGSIGFTGQARSILQTGQNPDPDAAGGMVLAVAKCNLAPLATSLGYGVIEDVRLGVGRIEWHGDVNHSAQDLQGDVLDAEKQLAGLEAGAWLESYLDDGLAHTWEQITKAGRAEGHAEITLRRQRGKIAVPLYGPRGRATTTWRSITAPPPHLIANPGRADGSDGSNGTLDEQMEDRVITQPPDASAQIETPSDPFDPSARPGETIEWADDAHPETITATLSCDVCGTVDGVASYPAGARCALHSPLVWGAS